MYGFDIFLPIPDEKVVYKTVDGAYARYTERSIAKGVRMKTGRELAAVLEVFMTIQD